MDRVTNANGSRGNDAPPWWDSWRGVYFAALKVLKQTEPDLIAEMGFGYVWLDVLARLADSPHGRRYRMQELQDASMFTRSGMTRLVDRMEQAGLVQRENVPGDRRGVFVVLTDKGMDEYQQAMAHHMKSIEREFGRRLTPEQHETVAAALFQFWHDAGPAEEAGGDRRGQ